MNSRLGLNATTKLGLLSLEHFHEISGLKEHPHGKLPFTLTFTFIRSRIVAPLQP